MNGQVRSRAIHRTLKNYRIKKLNFISRLPRPFFRFLYRSGFGDRTSTMLFDVYVGWETQPLRLA